MRRLLAFIPHPDDESYSFGGALALAADAGWECLVVCASSGEKGKRHDGGALTRRAVAAARERELRASCRALGCQAPRFLRLPDGGLRSSADGPSQVAASLEQESPDLILTLGPDGAYGHPDHLAVHRWVLEAWTAGGKPCPLVFPVFPRRLFLPQYQKCIGMMGDPPNPPAEAIGGDVWQYELDVQGVRERKLASISAHRSQLPGGDPEAIFPPGIVAQLLDVERFADATGSYVASTAALLGFEGASG